MADDHRARRYALSFGGLSTAQANEDHTAHASIMCRAQGANCRNPERDEGKDEVCCSKRCLLDDGKYVCTRPKLVD